METRMNKKIGRPPVDDPRIGVKISLLRSSFLKMQEIAKTQPGIPMSHLFQMAVNDFITKNSERPYVKL